MGSRSPSPTGRKTRRRIHNESDDDATEALVRNMAARQEQDNRRLKLEEQRYELEKKRIEDEERRFDANQESKRRKIILEEKKAAIEMEERKQAMVESARIIDVFAALAKKLEWFSSRPSRLRCGSAWGSQARPAALPGPLTSRFALRAKRKSKLYSAFRYSSRVGGGHLKCA